MDGWFDFQNNSNSLCYKQVTFATKPIEYAAIGEITQAVISHYMENIWHVPDVYFLPYVLKSTRQNHWKVND